RLKVCATSFRFSEPIFRRYNYTIVFGNSDDQFIEDLKQRSDYLEKYLNI
ncbi:MAG: acetoin utilization protein acuB, partial [Bacteroidota bacterium]